jgi:DNA processing protein
MSDTQHVQEDTVNTLTTATDLEARAAWSLLTEPGDTLAGSLTQSLGHAEALAAVRANPNGIADLLLEHGATINPEQAQGAAASWQPRLRDIHTDRALADAARLGIQLVDPTGIPGIADLGASAPHLLWVLGSPDALTAPLTDKLALIGARAATGYGEHVAREIANDLIRRGITPVASAAYGIDGAVHRAALAAGGPTIAWQANGLDRPYPAGHNDLISRIAQTPGSAVVSELAPGSVATRFRFLSRNRLIAATTAATVVVEAGWRSGTLHTASITTDLGRTLGAVPGPVTSPASAGCHRLIRDYDAQIVTSGEDAAELLGR